MFVTSHLERRFPIFPLRLWRGAGQWQVPDLTNWRMKLGWCHLQKQLSDLSKNDFTKLPTGYAECFCPQQQLLLSLFRFNWNHTAQQLGPSGPHEVQPERVQHWINWKSGSTKLVWSSGKTSIPNWFSMVFRCFQNVPRHPNIPKHVQWYLLIPNFNGGIATCLQHSIDVIRWCATCSSPPAGLERS